MPEIPPLFDSETAAVVTGKVHKAAGAKRKVVISCSNGGEGGEVRCSTSSSSSSGLDCCSIHGNGSDKEASEFLDLEKESNDISASTYGGFERREIVAESFDPKAAAVPGDGPDGNNQEAKFLLSAASSNNTTTQEVENYLVQVVGSGDDEDGHDDDDVNSRRRRRRPKKAKMPSNAELEDFFSVTENDLMRQFTHRYNFDFVKEEPLEGRYEWVPVRVIKP